MAAAFTTTVTVDVSDKFWLSFTISSNTYVPATNFEIEVTSAVGDFIVAVEGPETCAHA